jgi:putative transposase
LVKLLDFCILLKANKYRLYPTDPQKELLDKHFGCGRLVFNPALETMTWAYSALKTSLSGYGFTSRVKRPEKRLPWLWEVNSQSLQAALLDLDMAVRQLFQWTCGKFPDFFPNFKRRSGKQSFLCPQNITVENGRLSIPKFKKGINIVLHREIKGIINRATLSKVPAGKYFVSILTETKEVIPAKNIIDTKTAVGIDLGVKTFAVLSDGTEFENQKYLKQSLERLRILQRRVSGKVTGGSNRKKSVKRLDTLPEKITNQRKDFLHKVTDAITRQYDRVCIEDLAVSNMIKNYKPSQFVSDAGWGMFGIFPKYKAD